MTNNTRLTGLMANGLDPNGWKARHNKAVDDYRQLRRTSTENERIVLALAEAIELLLASQWGTDGYVHPNVTAPIMQAFHDLLNIDLGRLDGGTLSSWLVGLAERHGIEEVL